MSLTPIWATKINDIYVKLFHLMRGVDIICFCFLKVHAKNKSELGFIFCFKLSSVSGHFLGFLRQ